jgi:hypothetical protein
MSVLAGVLFALAALVHPAREDAATVLNTTPQILTAHWFFAASSAPMLLGLVGLYVCQAKQSGRLGLAGFMLAFIGTLLVLLTGYYGFMLPLLASEAPLVLARVLNYGPVAALGGLTVLTFFPGLMIFGLATMRSRVLPRRGGLLLIIGAPLFLIGGLAVAFAALDTLYLIAILGSVLLGLGFIQLGYTLWTNGTQYAIQPGGNPIAAL